MKSSRRSSGNLRTAADDETDFVAVGLRRPAHSVASSRTETVLLSNSGDVLLCRCRASSYQPARGAKWQDEFAMLCCDAQCDDLTRQLEDSTLLCSPWNHHTRGGLLGGAPAQVAPMTDVQLRGGGGNYADDSTRMKDNFQTRAKKAFRSPPLSDTGFDDESIVPIRSFDYSHFADGGNDMLPPPNTIMARSKRAEVQLNSSPISMTANDKSSRGPAFLHGVPKFSTPFSQVKITQLSAHPLGSHVLLISNAGLLYSYGENHHGQLGIGLKVRGDHHGYVPVPTIVTPLVENGGKAITCAAGVSHSLVVVVTEAQRLLKSRPLNHVYADGAATEPVVHHQLYGFGRNDYMKIGLVSPKIAKAGGEDEMENVILPRRVALRCKVRPTGHDPSLPPQGIFAVSASAEHSAALVRRASGDVELYTWGNAMYGALGLPQASLQEGEVSAVRVVPVPSFVASLSRTSNLGARSSCLLLRGEFPTSLSLGHRCSFVSTSQGRCFSFGVSEVGMLGLGMRVREAHQPTEIALSISDTPEALVRVEAGATHVVATARSGNVYSWGTKAHAGLAMGDEHDHIQWSPARLPLPQHVVQAVPGFDNTIFVTDEGRVLSCGKASGRLGQGEVREDVIEPRPMYGGLQLFRKKCKKPPQKPRLLRGKTASSIL